MADPLLEALAQQKQYFNQNNFWGQAGDALGAVSTAYGQNQDEGSNPNSNLVGALLTGIGSGFMKGYGQQEVRRQTADFANVLRGVAKDYYSGGDLSSVYNSPYQALQDAAPALEFGRMQSQQERQNKLNDSAMMNGKIFQFAPNGQPSGVSAVPNYGKVTAYNEIPQKSLDIASQLEVARGKQDIENEAKGLINPKEEAEKKLKLEDDYRKEFTSSQPYKDFQIASKGFQSVLAAAQRDNRVTDQELGRGAVQASEPGLAVREGEFSAIQNSTSMPESIKQSITSALTGKSALTPLQRQEIVQWVARRYAGHKDQFDTVKNYYSSRLGQIGANPNALEVLPNTYPDIRVDQKTGTSYQVVYENGKPIGKKPL